MTAATLSRSPLSVGAAVAGPLARGGFWTIEHTVDFGSWAAVQFMRAPVAISLVIAAAGFTLLAGSNALFMQTTRHPAPLFYAPPSARPVMPAARPVMPAMRTHAQPVDGQTTGSLGPVQAVPTIDASDVLALQKKLVALKYLQGTPDGMFGKRTASAIKAFELKTGRPPRGKLTREILTAILSTSPVAEPMPAPTVAVAAMPPGKPTAVTAPAAAKPVPLASVGASGLQMRQVTSIPIAPPAEVAPQVAAAEPAPTAKAAPLEAAPAAPAVAAAPQPTPDTAGASVAMNSLPATAAVQAPAAVAPTAPETQVAALAPAPQPDTTSAAAPTTSAAEKLAALMGTRPPAMTPPVQRPVSDDNTASTDPVLINKIQQALASLGFLGNSIDGQPGEATAKAIRSFQVFYDYPVTGQASPQLLDLLIQRGATI